jgi:hypothetical protein
MLVFVFIFIILPACFVCDKNLILNPNFNDGFPNPDWDVKSSSNFSVICNITTCNLKSPFPYPNYGWFKPNNETETSQMLTQDVYILVGTNTHFSFTLWLPSANFVGILSLFIGGKEIYTVTQNNYTMFKFPKEVAIPIFSTLQGDAEIRFSCIFKPSQTTEISGFLIDNIILPTSMRSLFVSTNGKDFGRSCTHNKPCATIQKAIDLISNGDEILVLPGTYYQDSIDSRGYQFNLVSQLGAAATIINGYKSRIFNVKSSNGVLIQGFTLINGSSSYGGIYITNSNVVIENCKFLLNENTNSNMGGGAIFGNTSTIKILSSEFYNNTSTSFGGAITLVNSDLHISECNITNCKSVSGAGLFLDGGQAKFENNNFSNNFASNTGGSLFIRNQVEVNISGCSLIMNTANKGGAIFMERNSKSMINNCKISSNKAHVGGGNSV